MFMRLAYIANIRFPSERAHAAQIAHMCQAFTKCDLIVDLIVGSRSKEGVAEIKEKYGFKPAFNFFKIQHGMFSHKSKLLYYLGDIFFTINYLLRFGRKKHDLILSRDEFILFLLMLLVGRKKIIWESHDLRLNFFAKYLIKKNIFLVTTSKGLFDEYRQLKGNDNNLLLAHNGVDESFFAEIETKTEARKRLGIVTDQKVVMYIGGLDVWKGVDAFLEASKLCTDALFVIIGGDEQHIGKLKVSYPRVKFLGSKPYSELKDNQQAADILVVPNTAKNDLSEKYTSPLKLFAHMTSGIPIVASDITSIKSVSGSRFITLSPPDNGPVLLKALESVFENYDQKQINAKKLQSIARSFTWENRANAILSFVMRRKEFL